MAYVYLHKKSDTNEIFYVGIGSDLKYERANTNRNRNKISKSNPNSKSVNKFQLDGILIQTYHSIGTACSENNISVGNMVTYLKKPLITKQNKTRVLGGYIWKFVNNK